MPKIETYQHDPIEAVERIIANMPKPPEIVRQGTKAYYSVLTDRVTLPQHELFISADEEACTTTDQRVGGSNPSGRADQIVCWALEIASG